eukprot:9095094-Pyramimonas_sp.AAC.1
MIRNGCCIDLYLKFACVPKLGGIWGPAWDSIGSPLGPPMALSWGSPEVLLGPSWGFVELSWGVLGLRGALLGRLWALLGLFWGVWGAFLGLLGVVWEASWCSFWQH